MKKFFYSLVMMAISMMTFVSCSSDDDDAVASKSLVGGVICEFSQDELDLYNIKISVTGPNSLSYGTFNINSLTPVETDKDGVKKFVAEFTVKELPFDVKVEASCSKTLADMQADKKYSLVHCLQAGVYKEKGEGVSKLNTGLNRSVTAQSGEKMGNKMESGKSFYEDYIRTINMLSTTIKN